MNILTIDIGGTSIKSGIFNGVDIIDIKETPTEASKKDFSMEKLLYNVISLYSDYDKIGISSAGMIDTKNGIVLNANKNLPGYKGMEIKKVLESKYNKEVCIENDANAAALGELKFGVGKGKSDLVGLVYGTGVGCGIILNGKVYHGKNFTAGEIGTLIIHPEDRDFEKDEFSGGYEKYASTRAFVGNVGEKIPEFNNGRIIMENLNNPIVKEEFNRWIDEIVIGLTNIIHFIDPPMIVLGGGIMEQDIVIDEIKKKLYKNILPQCRGVEIVKASLGNKAGMFGAAATVMEKEFS